MILFTILLIALIVVTVMIFVGGASFLLAFSDVLICGVLIYFIVKTIVRK